MRSIKKLLASKYSGVVLSTRYVSSNLNEITIKSDSQIIFKPGQYITVLIKECVPRNYSIASSAFSTNLIKLIVNIDSNGVGVRTLKNIQVNDNISFLEPSGEFHYHKSLYKHSWFIATGSGIAPLIPMIKEAGAESENIRLFFGSRKLKEQPDLSFITKDIIYTTTEENNEWKENKGRVQKVVVDELDKISIPYNHINYYICGSPKMVKDTKKTLTDKGISKNNIYYEKYGF